MKPSPDAAAAPEPFARRFRQRAGGDGLLSCADFIDLALYDPEVGYYRAGRERVGKTPGTDFYTASSLDGVFGPLVVAAVVQILGQDEAARHVFVELGAEPGRSILDGVDHPFASMQTLRLGQTLVVPEQAVVFANELLDAQPFHRVLRRAGNWREAAVRLDSTGTLAWCELAEWSGEVAALASRLPASAPEGYVLDLPIRAVRLLEAIAAQPWSGLFLTFDYGRSWAELCSGYPQGTGRAYRTHRQSDDLLACPGDQDITCHVCWDWLAAALHQAGFAPVRQQGQESFFVHHATAAIARLMATSPDPLSRTRSQLKHLLHPTLMGQRFGALCGARLEVVAGAPL